LPESDLSLLIDAAEEAGRIANRYFQNDVKVWHKPDEAGPVTGADLAVDDMLRKGLTSARPDYGWLSEETTDSRERLAQDRVFVVDPIDGTRAFIDGGRDWGHSLAVVEKGVVLAAAVHLPQRNVTYAAALGRGATRNGLPIVASRRASLDAAQVLATRPNLEPQHWRAAAPPPFHRAFRSSLAFRLCLVAEGRFDAMLTLRPTWEWDVAAGSLIVAEASGAVSDRLGSHPLFNNPHPQINGMVAGGKVLHEQLIDALF